MLLLLNPSANEAPVYYLGRTFISSGGGVEWSPEILSPAIWLDATEMEGLHPGLMEGDPVPVFDDISGNANDFIQPTAGMQPVYRAVGIATLPAVEGDGIDDILTIASMSMAANWWVAFVGAVDGFTTAGNVLSVDAYDPDGSYILVQLSTANEIVINSSYGSPTPNSFPAGVRDPHAYILQGTPSGLTVTADNGATGTSASGYTKMAAGMQLFGRGDGFNSHYRIGEFIYGTGTLSPSEVDSLWAYFNQKWSTAIP